MQTLLALKDIIDNFGAAKSVSGTIFYLIIYKSVYNPLWACTLQKQMQMHEL